MHLSQRSFCSSTSLRQTSAQIFSILSNKLEAISLTTQPQRSPDSRDILKMWPTLDPVANSKTISSSQAFEKITNAASNDRSELDLHNTFEDLGLVEQLCEACRSLKYAMPTPIQAQSIPFALQGRDIIALQKQEVARQLLLFFPSYKPCCLPRRIFIH